MKDSLNMQIIAEASEWLVELEAGDADPQLQQKFDAWLRQSPEHIRAYLELLSIWRHGAGTQFSRDTGPEALIAYARTEGNVLPLVGRREVGSTGSFVSSRFSSRSRLVAAAAAIIMAIGSFYIWRTFNDGPTYTTGIGEQRSVILPDGSTIELNAMSRLQTHFTEQQRSIELIQGQALFHVAKDAMRPFIVNVGGTHVRAVGTQFDVYRKKTGTVVTVVEGRVALQVGEGQGKAGLPATSILSAGEQITVAPVATNAIPKPKRANIVSATAWTQRRLVFDDSSLAEVAEEFNRYNTRPLVILDPDLDHFPISAAFSSTDPASLIRFLEAQPGIQVHETRSAVRISAQ